MNSIDKIVYVELGPQFNVDLGTMKMDSRIKVPFSLASGKENLKKEDYTVENLLSGLITVVADDEKNENFNYYKALINAIDPAIKNKLKTAAIAKEKRKEYDFALLLFKAVYHLDPTVENCINLATAYSYMAVDASKKKEDDRKYIKEAQKTLIDGLDKFGEDESLLYETASFEAFLSENDEAKEYISRYLLVAEEGERKEEMKKLKKEIDFKLDNEDKLNEAYDFLSLGEGDKALEAIDSFLKNNPDIWNGYFLKGWALRIKKEYKEAQEYFLKCIEKGESNAEIYNELSLCALSTGEKELSKIYLETALDLDEDNLTVLTNLSYLSLEDKDYDKAREYLEKARYIAKNDRIIDSLIKKYEKETGEKIGAIIHEEIVKGDEEKHGENIKENLFKSFEKEDSTICDHEKVDDDN